MFVPRKRRKYFDKFISEFNTKLRSNLKLSENEKSKFVNRLLSRDDPGVQNKGEFISTFFYPRIVDIRDIKKNRDIEISTPIPQSMISSLKEFYEKFIEELDYSLIYSFDSGKYFMKVFPLTFTGNEITFQVTKIEEYQGPIYRNTAYNVYFKPENEDITIKATFSGDDLKYPYSITLNGNEYEIERNGYVNKTDIEKKSEIENLLDTFQKYLQDLKNYRNNLINFDYLENEYGVSKENHPEINNDYLDDIKVKIEELKKELEDINIVKPEDHKKIEELRDAIQNLNIEDRRLNDFFEEKEKIKESQKKLLYFQFIEELSKYYYGKHIDTDISKKIQELGSILSNSSSDGTYPKSLVPSLTNQLKYLIKKEDLIQPIPSQDSNSIQLSRINTTVHNVKKTKSQLLNLNNIRMIFSNIKRYFNLTFPYIDEAEKETYLSHLDSIEDYFQQKYQ